MATRNVERLTSVPAESNTTPTPWWLWKSARTNAKTTIPRISNSTPVLLTIATRRTPKMLRSVIEISVTDGV